MHVKEYNRREMRRFSEAWDKVKWSEPKPQQFLYGFYTQTGNFRQSGYVAVSEDGRRHVWARTKKEAIAKLTN